MKSQRWGVRVTWLVLAVSWFASLVSAAEKYDALVVEGPHLNARSSRSVKAILESHLKLKVGTLNLEDLGRTDFTGIKVLYFPGATYLKLKLPKGAETNVRKAVAEGMGYIGTCGGSLVAAAWSGGPSGRGGRWPVMGLFPGKETFQSGTGMRPYYFETRHPVVARSSVAKEITPVFKIHYNGGPGNYIPSEDALPGLVHWVLAWQADKETDEKTDRPGVVAVMRGRGRVFLTTAHPERSWIPETHCVIKLAAEWCLGKSDPEVNTPPTVTMTASERGTAGEDLRFSAAGSDDPEGFPIGFIWDFGDGSEPVYTPQAAHPYAKEGNYTVTLTVTDGKDQSVRTRKVTIAPQQAGAHKPKRGKPGVPEVVLVRKCVKAPVIDGDLSDACWKAAQVPGVWIDIDTRKAPRLEPKVYMGYDDENVYFAFYNPEPDMQGVLAGCVDRDGKVWSDDSDEVFIDPTAGKGVYYHFIVNARNVLYDSHGKGGGAWNATAKTAVKRMTDAWALEISVPLAEIGVTGSPKGQTWTANFCRNRRGNAAAYMWSYTGADFHTPERFGTLRID